MKGFNAALRRENAERLKDYFGRDGAMTGLRSIHGPLVDMALSGGGVGARRQEGQITDRRFGYGGLAKEHRAIRAALIAIDSRHRDVLTAAYGDQRRWHPQVKRALLSALPDSYRDAFGAAILTSRVQQGMKDPKELANDIDDCEEVHGQSAASRRRKRARQVTGVVVWLPPSSAFKQSQRPDEDGIRRSEIDRIGMVVATLMHEAHLAFARELGQLDRAPAVKPTRQATRVDRVVPFSAPGGW